MKTISLSLAGNRSVVVIGNFLVLMLPVAAQAQLKDVVLPGSLAEVEGNSVSVRPLAGDAAATSIRFQQVFESSEFINSEAPFGGWIGGINFRADGATVGTQNYVSESADFQIRLSVTARGADELSPIFAENTGSGAALVRSGPENPIVLNPFGPVLGPRRFSAHVVFDQEYFYDPSQGNLLLEIINIGGRPFEDLHGNIAGVDAVNTVGDGVSSVFADGFENQIRTAGNVSTLGVVIAFNIRPVPEPSTWALMGVGAVILAWRSRYSIQRRKPHHATH